MVEQKMKPAPSQSLRPDMLFESLERLRAIARDAPFQIVVSGKAHPRDIKGKRLIEHINGAMQSLSRGIPCAYLPNYDLRIAKTMVPAPMYG
jgi:starch phosphorylase